MTSSCRAGAFTTDLLGIRWLWGFSPRAFLNAFFQYNTDTHEVSSNIRFNIVHHPLSDLYLVYNERRNTDAGHARRARVHRQADEPVQFLTGERPGFRGRTLS